MSSVDRFCCSGDCTNEKINDNKIWLGIAEIAAHFGKKDTEIYALARLNHWKRTDTDSGAYFAVTIEEVEEAFINESRPLWR